MGGMDGEGCDVARASPVRELAEEEWRQQTPNSPLLTAMREAVDSINQYDDFEILEKIGAGFFAEVFKVRHKPTEEVMVLKLNKKMTGIKKMKEVELLKKLYHPNILHYYGACVHNGQLHPLTEYMNGGALEQLIQDVSIPLPISLRLKLALDIARGMDYLHRHGMLHRDLNSKNCLLRKQGDSYTAVVADFGLAAKAPRVIRTMQRSQSVVGNPYWMAPEVLNGKPYDEKADVFSFGIILCELISRLEADPDELPRSRDYGLDEKRFRALPTVVDCNPPEDFLTLTFHCCQALTVKRPDFTELRVKLETLLNCHSIPPPAGQPQDGSLALLPEPPKPHRLSFHQHNHHHHLLLHNLDPSARETAV